MKRFIGWLAQIHWTFEYWLIGGPCEAIHPVNKLRCTRRAHSQTGSFYKRYHRAERANQLRPNATDVWLWHDEMTSEVIEAMREEYSRLGAWTEE